MVQVTLFPEINFTDRSFQQHQILLMTNSDIFDHKFRIQGGFIF